MQRFLLHALYCTLREGLSAPLHVRNDHENEIEGQGNSKPPHKPHTLSLLRHAGQAPLTYTQLSLRSLPRTTVQRGEPRRGGARATGDTVRGVCVRVLCVRCVRAHARRGVFGRANAGSRTPSEAAAGVCACGGGGGVWCVWHCKCRELDTKCTVSAGPGQQVQPQDEVGPSAAGVEVEVVACLNRVCG